MVGGGTFSSLAYLFSDIRKGAYSIEELKPAHCTGKPGVSASAPGEPRFN